MNNKYSYFCLLKIYPMQRKYKHLLFDLDDTLWDFETNALHSLQEVFFQYKLDKKFEHFNHFFEHYDYRNKQLWAAYGRGQITKKELNFERFNFPLLQVGVYNPGLATRLGTDFLRICPTKTALMPHAKDLLDHLSGKYQLHILSNGFGETQQTKLLCSGLLPYFDQIILSETIGALKPDRQIFDYALQAIGTPHKEVLMIGDNYDADIVGAHNAGIDQLFFNCRNKTNLSFQPTYEVKSLSEIVQILA